MTYFFLTLVVKGLDGLVGFFDVCDLLLSFAVEGVRL